MTGRRLATQAATSSVDELAGLIDQALELLSAYDTEEASLSEAEPLPSLLAQCQMLVDRPASEPPILRTVVSFGPLDTAAERLLQAQANLELLRGPGTPGSGARETRDAALPPAIRRADLLRAQQAALHGLARDLNASGRRLVVVLDALQGEADLLEGGPGDGHDPEAQDQAVPGLILSCHPLRSYLLARQRGLLPLGMATLEDYAAACLQTLSQLSHLPHLQLETLSTDAETDTVAAALAELCAALRLPPVLDARALDLPALDPVPPGALLYPDGGPATEDRLDSPAYQDLCQRLGYTPEQMPAVATAEQLCGPAAPLPALPARPANRSPSLLSPVLPRLAAVLEGEAAPAPFRLDLHGLLARLEDCLDHPQGTLEAMDACVDSLPPRDGALVLIASAAHFEAMGDGILAQSLLAEVTPLIAPGDRPLRLLVAELFLKLGKAEMALEILVADALDGGLALSSASAGALRATLDSHMPSQPPEHGHVLLLDYLDAHPPAQDSRRRVMIEIGTTRETVPSQGSTEKLAKRCAALGIDFITVDMDPRNSRQARRMFRRLGFPFRAETAKGEDFLAEWEGRIDYCFLDGYDFDHGLHSALRQSRYERFLGSRISNAECHRMHHDCATSLITKLAPDGVICFKDTWTDARGAWAAKGAAAMPLLLENGFQVLEARNRTALLARASDGAQTPGTGGAAQPVDGTAPQELKEYMSAHARNPDIRQLSLVTVFDEKRGRGLGVTRRTVLLQDNVVKKTWHKAFRHHFEIECDNMNRLYQAGFRQMPRVLDIDDDGLALYMEYKGGPPDRTLENLAEIRRLYYSLKNDFSFFHNDFTWANIVQDPAGVLHVIDFGSGRFDGHSVIGKKIRRFTLNDTNLHKHYWTEHAG